MKPIWTILAREYRERVKRRSFIVGTILGPVLILGVTVLPIWLATRTLAKPIHLLVVDLTGEIEPRLPYAFPDTLPEGSARYQFTPAPPGFADPDALLDAGYRERILAGEWTGMLWIPADAVEGGRIELYAQGLGDPEVFGRFQTALTRAAMMARLEAKGIAPEETDAIARRVVLKAFKISERGTREGGFEADFITGFLFAMILYMTIMLYAVSIQRSVLEDKTSRIIEVLLSAARPFHLMLGKIVGVGSVGLTQYAIWAVVAIGATAYLKASNPLLANAATLSPQILAFFIVYFVLGYLLFAALYAAIGAAVNSDQEAQQMQWPVTMLMVIPIILMQLILQDPDSRLGIVLSLVPFFSPILMMVRMNVSTPPAWEIALSIVILATSIVAMAALAGRIFRVGILMYGKRPTLPELLRWIRAR